MTSAHKSKTNFRFARAIIIILAVTCPVISISAQSKVPVSATVIVTTEYLRELPTSTSAPIIAVGKGTKLIVLATRWPGWYVAGVVEDATAAHTGFIYGNSIKLEKSIIKQPTRQKGPTTFPPKGIILVPVPEVEKKKPEAKKESLKPVLPNKCAPPLFCPDIGDIYEELSNSAEKAKKGKFEKTSDWEKRKANLLAETRLKNGHKTSDQMTFLYEEGTGLLNFTEAAYDADAEKWTFPLNFKSYPPYTCLPLMSEKTGGLYCLQVQKAPQIGTNAVVKMAPSVAAANNEKIQIAFVGKITSSDFWRLDYPKGDDIVTGVYFDLEKVICLNPKSGQEWKIEQDLPKPVEQDRSPKSAAPTLDLLFKPSPPLVSGTIVISGFGGIYLLDKSFVEILREGGVQPIALTTLGIEYDLVETFIKASKDPKSKKYKPFIDQVNSLIQSHLIGLIYPDNLAHASLNNIQFGTYFVFGFRKDILGTSVWDMQITHNEKSSFFQTEGWNTTYEYEGKKKLK